MNEKYSDAARRASDAYQLHRVTDPHGSIGHWLAIKLEDGSCDGVLYGSKLAAVKTKEPWERHYGYVQLGPWPFTPKEAETWLAVQRRMYERGLVMTDPEDPSGGRDQIQRVTQEDQRNNLRALFGVGPASNLLLPGKDF